MQECYLSGCRGRRRAQGGAAERACECLILGQWGVQAGRRITTRGSTVESLGVGVSQVSIGRAEKEAQCSTKTLKMSCEVLLR